MIKTEMDSMPSEMDDLAHRITQLQIEQVSLKKETDALSQSRCMSWKRNWPSCRISSAA